MKTKNHVSLVLFPADKKHWDIKKIKDIYPTATISFAGEKIPQTKSDLVREYPHLAEYLIN